MQHFKHLIRTKPIVQLSGQASRQNFGPLVRFGLLRLSLYFITNNTLLKNVHGKPFCAGHLDYVCRLLALIKELHLIDSIYFYRFDFKFSDFELNILLITFSIFSYSSFVQKTFV